MVKVSAVIPTCNEQGNVGPLYHALKETLKSADSVEDFEIIFVDDGSTDDTYAVLDPLQDGKMRVVRIDRRSGQSHALKVGCQEARYDVIVTMDADRQSDTSDILGLLDVMGEGYDCVCGWRHERRDPFVKKVSSVLANSMRRLVLGDNFQDISCPLKLFKKKCIEDIEFFSGVHRFFPYLMRVSGYKVVEHKVRHYPRQSGVSKYGVFNRVFKVIRDVFYVKFFVAKRLAKKRR